MTEEEIEQLIEAQLPSWATSKASDYMEVGACLPTRDGRRCGNATVLELVSADQMYARVITDAGNKLTLTRNELEELFHEPKYITDPDHCPAQQRDKAIELLRTLTTNAYFEEAYLDASVKAEKLVAQMENM